MVADDSGQIERIGLLLWILYVIKVMSESGEVLFLLCFAYTLPISSLCSIFDVPIKMIQKQLPFKDEGAETAIYCRLTAWIS
jgi:hypothetical protein